MYITLLLILKFILCENMYDNNQQWKLIRTSKIYRRDESNQTSGLGPIRPNVLFRTDKTKRLVSDRSDHTTIAKLVSKLDQFAVNGPDFTVINE